MRNSMIVAFVIFISIYLATLQPGNHGLWLTLLLFLLARGGIQQWLYWRRGLKPPPNPLRAQ